MIIINENLITFDDGVTAIVVQVSKLEIPSQRRHRDKMLFKWPSIRHLFLLVYKMSYVFYTEFSYNTNNVKLDNTILKV